MRTISRHTRYAALLATLVAGCSVSDRETSDRLTAAESDLGYSATDAEISQMGADGSLRYRLQAKHIEQDPNTLEVALEDIALETREREATRWSVAAPQGRLSSDSRRIELTGGVRLEGGSNRDSDRLRLGTPTLQYDLETARIRAAGDVNITLQGHVLAGTGLDANLRTRQVRLNANVRGRFQP